MSSLVSPLTKLLTQCVGFVHKVMDETHTLRVHRVLSSHNVVASVEAKESSEILLP